MAEYTPTTEEVRQSWIGQERMRDSLRGVVADRDEQYAAEFDIWLADVIQKAKDEAYEDMSHNLGY